MKLSEGTGGIMSCEMLTKQTWAVVGSHGKNPVAEQLSEVSTAMRVR